MTKSEREIWQQYHESLAQKKRLEDFLLPLKKPDETKKDAYAIFSCLKNILSIKKIFY